MDLGLNIAASGMIGEQVREDQIANELANASTPGYKATVTEQSSFGKLLLANTLTGQPIGSIDAGVQVTTGKLALTQGTLESTGQPLDFAITGEGFFGVKTSAGVQYTRNGQFSVNSQGLLVDQFGDDVLGQGGAPIKVGAKDSVPTSALGVFNLNNVKELGNNNFTGTVAGRGTGLVQSGQLEGSGVDSITAMVAMTSALQAYQAGQQAVQTINQTMQESASTVGLVEGR